MLARLSKWLAEQEGGSEASNDSAAESILRAPLDGAGSFKNRLWTDEQFPPLAAWIAENQQPLDLLVSAAAKPRFFSPPPNFLSDPETPVLYLLNPHAQTCRDAARALTARAMYRIGQGNYDDAWEDILACWRLAAHNVAAPSILDNLIGFSLRRQAMQATLALLAVNDFA